MKVLYVASECSPFIKTGGLADVIGSLPQALKEEGVDVSVVLPKYDDFPCSFTDRAELKTSFTISLVWRKQFCGIEVFKYKGIKYFLIDNEYYFKRNGLYGFHDEAERFTFFSKAVLEMLFHLDYKPDVIHCHDWQTAMIPVYLHSHYKDDQFYNDFKTVFTIHNIDYQGDFPYSVLKDILGLDDRYFDSLEFYGRVNFMKGALNYADLITTVSESYSREIRTPYFGKGLQGLLQQRSDDLYGIVNGIDTASYNPATDKHVFKNYERDIEAIADKKANKTSLQELVGLPVNGDIPMIVIISRLVEQKGFDLIMRMIPELVALDLQMVILGTGEGKYEQCFKEANWENPEKISSHITFNEDLARKIYAAGDLFLMPSKFEPCGIGQLIAFRYLTVPIVRKTGGLKDTVTDFTEDEKGNGFVFDDFNAHQMFEKIQQALSYYQDQEKWLKIIKNVVESDYSWKNSANKYLELYRKLEN